MKILAEYKCEENIVTVEVVDADDDSITIVSDAFPRVFVRHTGWCEQPSMTISRRYLKNVRVVTSDGVVLLPDPRPDAIAELDEWQAETQATREADYPR